MNGADRVVIETERLRLRTWQGSDAALLRGLWIERDPRVPPHRRIDAAGRPSIADLEARIDEAHEPLLIIEAPQGAIGYCGLVTNATLPADEPELAYELQRSSWGHGYATEAGRAVVDYARAAGYHRLWATVRDWNRASRQVLAKLGFEETGRVERDVVHGDSIHTALEL